MSANQNLPLKDRPITLTTKIPAVKTSFLFNTLIFLTFKYTNNQTMDTTTAKLKTLLTYVISTRAKTIEKQALQYLGLENLSAEVHRAPKIAGNRVIQQRPTTYALQKRGYLVEIQPRCSRTY